MDSQNPFQAKLNESHALPSLPGAPPSGPDWLGPLLILLALLGLATAAWLLPVVHWVERLETWIRGLGVGGALAYVAIYVVCTVLMAPGSALSVIAGPLYGMLLGTALVSAASTLGAVLAFLIARSRLRPAIERWAARKAQFRSLDRAVARQGLWIVFLLRLSPVIPFNVLNYALGLTGIGLVPYTLASWIGMLPGTAAYVLAGYAVPRVLAGGVRAAAWFLAAAATLGVTWLLTKITLRAVRRAGVEGANGAPPREVHDVN